MYIIKNFISSKSAGFILFVSMLFFILVLANYFINLHILKNVINDLQVDAINNASKQIITWTKEKIKTIQNVENIISNMDHVQEQYAIGNLLEHSSSVAGLPYMFVGYRDNTIISSRTIIKPLTYSTIAMPWYRETIRNEEITITKPYVSSIIDALVVAVCSRTKDVREEVGVVCGILPLTYIQQEILKISLPYDGNVFLLDKNKKILVHKEKDKIFKKFEQKLDKEGMLTVTKDNIFSQGFVEYGNWYLISQLDKNKVYERVDFQLKVNLVIYAISLMVFLWLNLFYNRHQRQSDEKLKVSKTLMKNFITSDDRGCLIADCTHKVTYYNKEFSKLVGLNEDIIHKESSFESEDYFQRIPLWLNDCLRKMIHATKVEQKTFKNVFHFFENKTKIYLLFTSIPVKDTQKQYQGIILFVEDVTKKELAKRYKKEQEDILFQQTKMADLGEMLGAISHQWRQPLHSLSLLLGNLSQFKQMGCLSDEIFDKNIEHALSSTNYLSNTIDTFRSFYLPNKELQAFELIEAINHTNLILEPYFKNSGIDIELIHKDDKYLCNSYKNEFQQIIFSLLLNARDALLEDKSNKNKSIKIRIENEKEEYILKIEDNGSGINTAIKDTLFEPFKTTKDKKGGTGTGLYLSKLIANTKLQGSLEVLSNSNPTTFLFKLPKKLKENND